MEEEEKEKVEKEEEDENVIAQEIGNRLSKKEPSNFNTTHLP